LSGGDHCWFKRITRKKRPLKRDMNNNNNNNNMSIAATLGNHEMKRIWKEAIVI